jgi:21S rRNA (GM2251-2'-O)-methyltransferase
MNCHVLSTRASKLRSLRRYYHVGKAASVNSAIERNLRKFGPNAKPGDDERRSESWDVSTRKAGEFSEERRNTSFESRKNSFARSGTDDAPRWSKHQPREERRTGRSTNFSNGSREETRFGKSLGHEASPRDETRAEKFSKFQKRPSLKATSPRSSYGRKPTISTSNKNPSLVSHNLPTYDSGRFSDPQHRTWSGHHRDGDAAAHSRQPSTNQEQPKTSYYDQKRATSFTTGASDRAPDTLTRAFTVRPRPASLPDKLPVSIPYTTPASEFLYGTSVVEAALRSQRVPRRKLYKLYIYNGENRKAGERDDQLERLARKTGVEVVRVGNEGLRLMEKLSSGRPHNGYILEASPIPSMPVQSLGRQIVREGQSGYLVTVGHQSREEAIINGASDFQPTNSSSGRMPFVLLLDGIVDPGNMGKSRANLYPLPFHPNRALSSKLLRGLCLSLSLPLYFCSVWIVQLYHPYFSVGNC